MLSIQISGCDSWLLLSFHGQPQNWRQNYQSMVHLLYHFICIFILFSNLWSFAIPLIISFIDFLFPSVKFVINGKNYFHWSVQAIIGAIASAVILYFISSMLLFALEMLNSIIKK